MSSFEQVFGIAPESTGEAPGRVNLLGEHTDYNDGFVLPTVIPQRTCVRIARSKDRLNHFHSVQLGTTNAYLPEEAPPGRFATYVHGCIEMLREQGHDIPRLCVHVDSAVPIGAGLSSSAALEVAMLRALRMLLHARIDDVTLALLAQQAEWRHAGVRCGIMDQMAASVGKADMMLLLDTRSLETALLPLPIGSAFVVIDSGVRRTLAGSGYNERRAECEAAARFLGVAALRDIDDVALLARLPAPLARRARHVITENERVLQAARGISAEAFGALMTDSHASLRDDFEVSVPALDALVDILHRHPSVHGARLTGAGFGGACVALVAAGSQEEVKRAALGAYALAGYGGSALV